MVYMKTYMFNHFYYQCLVLLTMAPRNSWSVGWLVFWAVVFFFFQYNAGPSCNCDINEQAFFFAIYVRGHRRGTSSPSPSD